MATLQRPAVCTFDCPDACSLTVSIDGGFITKVRGSWKLYKGTTLVMPTYHPSYLLRPSPQQVEAKRQAWEDLQAVMKELKLPMPGKKG